MIREENSWIITEDSGVTSDEPDIVTLDSAAIEPQEVKRDWRTALVNLVKGSPAYLLALTFLGGLFLGWIVIGRWVSPAKHNADPWDLRPEHQANFISLVAEDYWRTRDVVRARQALADWDEGNLAELVGQMQAQASTSEARQHLLALKDALELPEHQESLLATLFGETAILLSLVFSALPLLAALIMVVSPRVRQSEPEGDSQEIEELVIPDTPGDLFEGLPDQVETEQYDEEGVEEGEGEPENQQPAEEEEDEEEDWEEEWDEEEEEFGDGLVADILRDLFDDDDEALIALEALASGLKDIAIDDLLKQSQEMVQRFETERPAV